MRWSENHSLSERLAAQAQGALREGDNELARDLYSQAAQAEANALSAVDKSKMRTLGVTAVSAAALWYKAGNFRNAESLAHKCLGSYELPSFASGQLKEILEQIWTLDALRESGIAFSGNEVLVSVSGGEIVRGGAPLDLIQQKVEQVSAVFYRTAEWLLDLPHRIRGLPDAQVREACRPWLFQAAPGSYQFAVRVEKPKQGALFPELELQVEKLSETFMQIVRTAAEDPEDGLKRVVPNTQYRQTFLKLTRQLAPSGRSYKCLSIRAAGQPEVEPIVFEPESREVINSAIRKETTRTVDTEESSDVQLQGILRALHLDEDWIEMAVKTHDGEEHIRVYGVGDEVDDILGPMVNHDVIVEATRTSKGKYLHKDIQPAE